MKKNILKITGVCIILLALLLNVNRSLRSSNNELLLSNVLAISQAQAEGGNSSGYRCWAEYSGCWFFGCTHIQICGQPCVEKTADNWSAENTCQ